MWDGMHTKALGEYKLCQPSGMAISPRLNEVSMLGVTRGLATPVSGRWPLAMPSAHTSGAE